MANTVRGHVVPEGNSAPDVPLALTNLSNSLNDIIVVASTTERDQKLAALQAAGVTKPVFAWRTDINNLEFHRNTGAAGEAWEYLSGRQHGATVVMSTANLREARDDVVFPASFTRSSTGWSIAGDGMNLVIPGTGMYQFDISGAVTGTAGDLGRVYTQFMINNTVIKGRQGVANENNIHASLMYPLNAGDQIKVEMYHETGGTRGFNGELQIAQINAPRW